MVAIVSTAFVPFKNQKGGITLSRGRLDYTNQIFDFTADGTKERFVFHIPTLNALIVPNWKEPPFREQGAEKLTYCFPRTKHIDFAAAQLVIKRNGVDVDYARTITPDKPQFNDPGIICMFTPLNRPGIDYAFEEVIVDGNNRLVARALVGRTTMRFWMVPEPIWRNALLDIPDDLLIV